LDSCAHCGASLGSDDERCPSCGVPRLSAAAPSDEPPPDDDPPQVPVGTWASTSDHDGIPASTVFAESDTRRIRRIAAEAAEDDDARRERAERVEREHTRPVRRRGRGRGVAPAADLEEQADGPEPPRDRLVAIPGGRRTSERPPALSSGTAIRPPDGAIAPTPTPKWLASELLREDVPAEPYGWTSRIAGVAAGVVGAAIGVVVGDLGGIDLLPVVLFAGIAAVSMLPVSFSARAGGYAVLGLFGLVVCTLARIGDEGDAIGLATLGTTLLAAAQLLRRVQRSSKFARIAMASASS
jgi:hypothetical protein